ncbi:helix-turn-helix transcriptional regulator [Vibrio sp. OPT18]|uniref:helix-turn-helix transcriptional regulator n=1 Tax=Vibrio sp. OPT18 TaxID=2778641 RepID=UPI0018817DF1|nr:WYL domain-containing protein [Vibrio sp. OPT18]MBE8575426.1 WYL domain-containing protein [Vibrio sp. OPT18]
MSAKAFGDFYCYLHCMNLLSIKEHGITPKEYLDDVRKEPFYYRGDTSKEAQQKWAERILESIYKYHGIQGDGPNGHNDLLIREGIASKARYKIREGAEFDVNPGLHESIAILNTIGSQLLERVLPAAGSKLSKALTLLSRSKNVSNTAPFKMIIGSYDLIAPNADYTVLSKLESALENRLVVSFEYEGSRCEVDPYASFVYQRSFYLVGLERYRKSTESSLMLGDYRTYKVHNINNLEVHSTQSFSMGNQKDFCLHDFLSSSNGKMVNGGETCEVVLKMKRDTDGYNKFVDEYKLSECQKIEEIADNHYIVRAQARDSVVFKSWLINNADCVEILTPLQLRTDVIQDIKHAMSVYAH